MSLSSRKMASHNPQEDLELNGSLLHQKMLAGELTAFAEIAEFALPILTERLMRRFPNLADPHLVDTAVIDALFKYQEKPTKYDPSKMRLDQYFYMSARGDLLNLLKTLKKDQVLVSLAEIVELDEENSEIKVELPSDIDVEGEVFMNLNPTWQTLCQLLPNSTDQEVLLLMIDGIRETSVYSEVLKITDLSAEKQFSIVKRNKDRIKKTLLRHKDSLDLMP